MSTPPLMGRGRLGSMAIEARRVEFATLLDAQKALRGGLFTFRGFRFALWLSSEPIPDSLSVQSHGANWTESGMLYHLPRIQWKFGRWISHYIHVMWPGPIKRPRA